MIKFRFFPTQDSSNLPIAHVNPQTAAAMIAAGVRLNRSQDSQRTAK